MKLKPPEAHVSAANKQAKGKEQRMKSYLIDLGKMNYQDAHSFQLECVQYRLGGEDREDIFVLVEHPPVFTLGKRGGRGSLTVAEQFIANRGVDIVETERGGDITYHGPGQLVIYPIVHLRDSGLSVKSYVDLLEELMIAVAAGFQVEAARDPRNRGIWVGDNKIGSIGIRIRRGVTFHGLALNVSLDFEHFSWIQPCGLSGVGVTSIARESQKTIDFDAAKESAVHQLARLFDRQLIVTDSARIKGQSGKVGLV